MYAMPMENFASAMRLHGTPYVTFSHIFLQLTPQTSSQVNVSVDGSLHVGGGITGETVELIFGLIAALRQDVDTLRGENTELHEENRELRAELSAIRANFTGQVQNTHTVYNYRLQQVESLVGDMNEQLEEGIPNWEATPSPLTLMSSLAPVTAH